MKKTRRIKRGGAQTRGNLQRIKNAKTNSLRKKLEEIQDIAVEGSNNGLYSRIKKTFIPVGTIFYFRSQTQLQGLENRMLWVDYTASLGMPSFLLLPKQDNFLSIEASNKIIGTFGSYLNEVEVIKPLEVVHFPVDYTSKEASESDSSYSGSADDILRNLYSEKPELFLDGYTIDFFFREMGSTFQPLSWLRGYRRLIVFKPREHFQLNESYYSVPGIKSWQENFRFKYNRLKDNLTRIQEDPVFHVEDFNNGNYDHLKKTIIPEGAVFQFRSKTPINEIQPKAMWLDYSASLGKPSFLLKSENPRLLDPSIPKSMEKDFGQYVNTVVVIKPLEILHFPVRYDSQNESEEVNTNIYSAYYETIINQMCVGKQKWRDYNYSKACGDGYTLDFLFRKMRPPYANWVPGFRELCIYRPHLHLEIISSEYVPV